MATKNPQALTPVTLGWKVMKSWRDAKGIVHEKQVSVQFSSINAANVFRDTAEKTHETEEGKTEIKFHTVSISGFDDLPPGGM